MATTSTAMSSANSDRSVKLVLNVAANHPHLLEGLDTWLQLELINDHQVKAFCQRSLTCAVPTVTLSARSGQSPPTTIATATAIPYRVPAAASAASAPQARSTPATRKVKSRSPGLVDTVLGRLMAELSVVWLLCLGVFLVVVSSALLAASQWSIFSPTAQYLVLFAYTVVFWGGGLWASGASRLTLTAKTLQNISLLLVPINLWAMHGLPITQTGLGLLVAIGATMVLSFASYRTFQFYSASPGERPQLNLINFLGLAGLHWLWQGDTLPLWLVYGATLATATTFLSQSALRQQWRSTPATPSPVLNGPRLMVLYALGMVMMRGFAHPMIDPQAMGLAIGICGAMLCALAIKAWVPRSPQSVATQSAKSTPTVAPQSTPNPFGEGPLIPSDDTPRQTPASQTASTASTVQSSLRFTQLWIFIGRSLMFIGWLMTLTTLPIQALGVSLLGLALRTYRLRNLWLKRDLIVALSIGLQCVWLGWRVLPEGVRQTAIAQATRLTSPDGMDWALLGIAYFPYVVITIAIADWLSRRRKPALVPLAYGFGLVLGVYLTLISVFDTTVLALNLIASTLTLLIITLRYQQRGTPLSGLVYSTHGVGLLTIAVATADAFPNLSMEWQLVIGFSLTTLELGLSIGISNHWRRSAWLFGNGLVGLSNFLLLTYGLDSMLASRWMLLAFVPPLSLTMVSSLPASQRRQASHGLAIVTLLFATLLCLGTPANRLLGLSAATILMGGICVLQPRRLTAGLSVGLGLGLVASLLQDLAANTTVLSGVQWYPIGAMACAVLWMIWHGLGRLSLSQQRSLTAVYRAAVNGWGFGLCTFLLVVLSLESFLRYLDLRAFQPTYALAAGILIVAGLIRNGRGLNGSVLFFIGWAVELGIAEVLAQQSPAPLNLAIANIALGAMSLGFGSLLAQRFRPLPLSLQAFPILYSVLALGLRIGQFTSWTGFLTLGAALISLEVGRRHRQAGLRAIALMLLSIAWYELVIYQMLQASGGSPADGWVILAGVAAVIMIVYQLLARSLESRLGSRVGLPANEFRWAAHFHWFIGSSLLLLSTPVVNREMQTAPVAFAIGAALVAYALAHGRFAAHQTSQSSPPPTAPTEPNPFGEVVPEATTPEAAQSADQGPARPTSLPASATPRSSVRPGTGEKLVWTWIGIGQLLGLMIYARLLFPWLAIFDDWVGAGASVVASIFYYGPWARGGWLLRPWRATAIALPLLTALGGFLAGINVVNLWVTAGFYGGLSWRSHRIRLSYLSSLLILVAIYQWLGERGIIDLLAYSLPMGLFCLYVAQVDPQFRQRQSMGLRHLLRLLGTGLILGVALVSERWTGIPVGILSLGAIALGLALQVRAFLYTGTAVLVCNVLNQLVVLNDEYPLTKWIVGMLVGILLIWIAADFERRREQWSSLAQRWQTTLSQWE